MRNWMLGLLVSLLALPVYGQVTITGMTLGDVSIVATAPGGPTCSGAFSESFDGTGTDQSWVDQSSGSGVWDEDNATRTEDYFSGNSLRAYATGGFSNAYSIENSNTAYDPYYMAFSFYLDSESLADTESMGIAAIGDNNVESLCVMLHDDSGVVSLELWYGDNCFAGEVSDTGDSYVVSLDTVYIVELYADNVGASTDIGGWRIFDCGADGTECTTTPDHTYEDTAMEILVGSNDRIFLGLSTSAGYADAYYGFIEVDSSQVCN